MEKILAVGIGGFVGANLRYWLGSWVIHTLDTAFPWGTFVVNIIGCFGLAIFATLVTERITVSEATRLMVATGFFGALTTFSTFSLETLNLITAERWLLGLTNVTVSVGLGLLATIAGVGLARAL